MLANRKYEELSYPQKSENVLAHYSQSSPENATPSSATSPLAPYKEDPFPPHPPGGKIPRRYSGSSLVCYVLSETFCEATILKVMDQKTLDYPIYMKL